MQNLKQTNKKNLFTKQKQTHRLRERNFWFPGRKRGGKDRLGVGIDM